MSGHPRKVLKEIKSCLSQYGIEVIAMEFGGAHKKLQVTDGKKVARIPIPNSGSHRAYLNIAQTARKALREAP